MEKVKIYGTEDCVDNSISIRSNLKDEENIYSSVFGIFPRYKLLFGMHFKDHEEKSRKVTEIFDNLVKDGFEIFSVGYSNNKEYEYEENDEDTMTDEIMVYNYILYNDYSLISFGVDWGGFTIMSHDNIGIVKDLLKKYIQKHVDRGERQVKCNIISSNNGFYMDEFEINLKGDLDFGLYNEGFDKINEEIVRSIREDDNGLYIFHGEAGTGKTTYIRHLIKQLKKEKKFVYVPSNLVGDITSPMFISFIMENKNCVFVIEDCENLVVTKNNMRSSAVADMLNMTDGLLADALKIKFICTFNTNEKNIDEALLRPGRCRMKYDFGKLSKDRAVAAAERLGLKVPDKDISLAELFAGENRFVEEKRKIGF